MHIEALVRMANHIGGFLEAMPDRTEALQGAALLRESRAKMRADAATAVATIAGHLHARSFTRLILPHDSHAAAV